MKLFRVIILLSSLIFLANCSSTTGTLDIKPKEINHSFNDAMPLPKFLGDDAKYSFEAVKDFIGESFTELRKVYKAYGAMGGGSTMSMHEFLAMIRDCKLIDKNSKVLLFKLIYDP